MSWRSQRREGAAFYGVNVFYIDGENLIMRMPVDGRQMNINTGKIENTGAEVQFAYRFSPVWSVDANYSYLHMEQPVLASPRHKAYAGATFFQRPLVCRDRCAVCGRIIYRCKNRKYGKRYERSFVMWNLQGQFRAGVVDSYLGPGRELTGTTV